MKAFCLFMVLLGSLGMIFYSHEAQSAIAPINTSQFTWHMEESFHAHGTTHPLNSSNNAEEEDDEVNDEDEFNLKCVFLKKDILFTPIHFLENLISIHAQARLSKPFLKPQFTPPDFILIA